MEDEDKKYCKICLVTDCKMFSSPSISEAYSQLVQDLCDHKLYVCYECKHLLSKCQEFRSKCMMAVNVLSSIHMYHSEITKRNIRDIDRKHFKLESKLSHSTLVSTTINNSNEQVEEPESSLDFKIKIETDTLDLEDEKSEIKFDPDAGDPFSDSDDKQDVDTDPDAIEDHKPDIKFDPFTNKAAPDTEYPNEIFLTNHAPSNMIPEVKSKRKCALKSKKIQEAVPKEEKILKHMIKKRNSVELPLSNRKSRKPSYYTMRMIQNYTTIDAMTPSQAKNEILLKKESKNYKTNPHKCVLCYKGFVLENTYNNHMKKHNPDSGTVECDFCHLFFRRKGELTPHIEGCHKYKITCKLCPYICSSPVQAKNHIAIHKGESYTCELCEKTFRYPSSLANHKRLKHPECVCAYCGSLFGSTVGLKIHKLRSHEKDSTELLGPKCEECDVQFATETAWKRHLVLSSRHTVSNGCEECGATFPSAKKLENHVKTHSLQLINKGKYAAQRFRAPGPCKTCGEWMKTQQEYNAHKKSQHPPRRAVKGKKRGGNLTQYICELCGSSFKNLQLLQYHRNKHAGVLPYECDECGKKYGLPSSLHNHKSAVHSGGRRFCCDLCQKSYHTKERIARHMQMSHLGIRPHKCTLCDKGFFNRCDLKTHIDCVHYKKPWRR